MTKEEAIELLANGRYVDWNNYRERNPEWIPDLSNLDLSNVKLAFDGYTENKQFNLTRANLCGANLSNIENIFYRFHYYNEYLGASSYEIKCINLKGAVIDIFTKFPQGIYPTKYGAVLISVAEKTGEKAGIPPTIFISYAWANDELVMAIDQWLRLKGLKTKIDKRDFFAGSRIRDEIIRVMQQCDVVVIFYSGESKDKPWTMFEQELASDLEMESKKEGRTPPRIIYFVLDEISLPSVTEKNRIAVMAKGKTFEVACEELYYGILQISKDPKQIDLNKWSDYVF